MKYISILVVSLLLSIMVGCISTKTKEGTGEFLDDSAITANVKISLLKEPNFNSTEVSVETFKGVVQLSGFVNSQSTSDKAKELAFNTRGVKQVVNSLQIR